MRVLLQAEFVIVSRNYLTVQLPIETWALA